MPLSGGQTFAGYKIVRLLGSGGMGEVYLAEHPRLPRRDALKVLPADISADPDYRARFNREADLASKLWHPHIVSVHDRGEFDEKLWISMDFVDGLDAARLLATRYPAGMPADHVVRIVTAIASALDYAHKQGLLHRDVKPANIMLTHLDDDDDEQRILLTDFGIARNVGDISGLTATNMTVGTVAYSAPEQLMGEDIDGRADQYALAATAYHLLTGSHLFPHSNPAVVISRHLNAPPQALAEGRPELAPLDPVLAAALAKDPEQRFQRCADFVRALAEQSARNRTPSSTNRTEPAPYLGKGATVMPSEPSAGPVTTRPSAAQARRWLVPVSVTAAIFLVGALALTWRPWDGQRSTAAKTNSDRAPAVSTVSSTTPAPQPAALPPAVLPAKAIDSVLLTPDEVNSILGTYDLNGTSRVGVMKVDRSTYGMADNSSLVTPPSCAGVVFGAEHEVYANTGFDALRDQTFNMQPLATNATGSAPVELDQTVIVFPSADLAQTVLAAAQNQWRTCASSGVDQKTSFESGYEWKLAAVQRQGDLLSVKMAANGAMDGPAACQQALGARQNVVVSTRSCNNIQQSAGTHYDPVKGWPTDPSWASNDAARLANAMLGKIKF
ncbi:serine/threonine-protein kinase PknH/PknJ [Mycobacterium sp. Dal123C01]|uniref:serine/threonine-protein kinase PknH/PknJ n=1 Tax=Mycobacterium sp. Dal123C01 TaxID=3457577 RepID=UPI00403ECE91